MRFLKFALIGLVAILGSAAVLAQSGTESRWQNSIFKVFTLQVSNALNLDPVAGGSSLTLTEATHDGKTILLDTAAGTAITLPAATGSGMRVKVIVSATVTSNDHTIACAGTDEFAGVVYQVDTDTSDAVAAYPALAADNFDVITMNGSTTGGLAGDWYMLEDIASGVWALVGYQNGTGVVATPLSAT